MKGSNFSTRSTNPKKRQKSQTALDKKLYSELADYDKIDRLIEE